MKYRQCTHYNEILKFLAENRDLNEVSFEINDIQNCNLCYSETEESVCNLWVMLTFVRDMNPQLGIPASKVTIDTLDEQIGNIALQLIRNSNK